MYANQTSSKLIIVLAELQTYLTKSLFNCKDNQKRIVIIFLTPRLIFYIALTTYKGQVNSYYCSNLTFSKGFTGTHNLSNSPVTNNIDSV